MKSPGRLLTLLLASLVPLALIGAARAEEPKKAELLVFAAASLADVLNALSPGWEATSGIPVRLSVAGSSVLARQIEAGSNVEIFISADEEWMNYLQARGQLANATRRNLAGNRLVLIAPADSKVDLNIRLGFGLAAALGNGRLSVADPDTVPAGRYARAALTSLGVWNTVADRLARADNVRGALQFVARGETPLGIVYSTDAAIDPRVRVVDVFPADTHSPIRYPAAAVKGSGAAAAQYLDYLGSPAAIETWKKFGFLEISR
ncbi:MAG TPA: molybdate ABC transporter substrate-binding protein [Steroidobacteraceae bacterium]|nr:molybdate ABC transporter substrate-binding protein [Steroidobacteraceae bacterium]